MFADLHIHTYFSDGSQSPLSVMEEVLKKNIQVLSICDHNTIEAYTYKNGEFPKLCKNVIPALNLITGVEMDCMLYPQNINLSPIHVHVLGYGFDVNNSTFQQFLTNLRGKLDYYNNAAIYNMAKDYPLDLEDYESFVSPPEMGGYKNSNYLLLKGFIPDIPSYFPLQDTYGLSIDAIGLPSCQDVCSAIHQAGGIAVLAHPWDMLPPEHFNGYLKELTLENTELSIDGLECYYPSHDKEQTEYLVSYAQTNGLCTTGGCDGHGTFNHIIRGVTYEIGIVTIPFDQLTIKEALT